VSTDCKLTTTTQNLYRSNTTSIFKFEWISLRGVEGTSMARGLGSSDHSIHESSTRRPAIDSINDTEVVYGSGSIPLQAPSCRAGGDRDPRLIELPDGTLALGIMDTNYTNISMSSGAEKKSTC
jgi:hypothetical protein